MFLKRNLSNVCLSSSSYVYRQRSHVAAGPSVRLGLCMYVCRTGTLVVFRMEFPLSKHSWNTIEAFRDVTLPMCFRDFVPFIRKITSFWIVTESWEILLTAAGTKNFEIILWICITVKNRNSHRVIIFKDSI
jgi:hypothetical protein